MDQDSAPYISKKQKPNSELVHAEYTCKFYNKFSFKTMLVVIFLAALALFPFKAPEIISQTGTWELVQLILVGVAVSYGLFSRKSVDDAKTENEYIDSSKFDNVQSRLLEVSSFFENHQVSDESRVQTWNNYQYSSGKPLVVVAKESDDVTSSRIPLVLPIRSLKSPVTEPISTTTNSPKSSVSPPPLQVPSIVKKSTLLKSSSIVTNGQEGSSLRRSTRSVPFELRDKSAFKGKSVRTIRPFIGAARASFINGKTEDERNKEVDTQMQLMELSGEEKKVESDENSDDYIEESSENVEEASKNVSDSGPENVDKKADEFIAKFREQIKLQRIQSTRISPGQPAKKLLQWKYSGSN